MTKLKKVCIFVFILSSVSVFAQGWEAKIGQSTSSKLSKNKPAQIIATFPQDTTDNSSLIDGFIELNYSFEETNLKFNFFAELHKNTLIAKEQNVQQFGVGLSFPINDFKLGKYNIQLTNDFTYRESRDFVKRKSTNQLIYEGSLKLMNSPVKIASYLRANSFLIPESNVELSKFINVKHDHSFGFGYLYGSDNVVIRNLNFELDVYPLSALLYHHKIKKAKKVESYRKLVEEIAAAQREATSLTNSDEKRAIYRKVKNEKEVQKRERDLLIDKEASKFRNFLYLRWILKDRTSFLGSTDDDLGTFQKLTVGLNYNIAANSSFGLAYSWQRGPDIYTGLEDQDFNTLAATFKLNL